jgi:glycosyltransferase involved in cell wall biosynthesis
MPLPALYVVVPGDIDIRTGGYGYDRRIVDGLRGRGWRVTVVSLPGSFPFPSPRERATAAETLNEIPDGALVLADGLAFGALPDETARESGRIRFVALVHHPLARETGLEAAAASLLSEREGRALASARGIIVTSTGTMAAVKQLRPEASMTVVEPGTDRAPLAQGSADDGLRLLCVASVVPRKGHDTLVAALAQVRSLDWRLVCAGSLERSPEFATSVLEACVRNELQDRIDFAGELEGNDLAQAYHHSDLFVLPTRYEGYGMAVAEALAHGIPVVSTPTGAIAELVAEDAGVLVRADAPDALAEVLGQLLRDRGRRERLRDGARRRRLTLRTWDVACAEMESVLLKLAAA